jgi:hypothetical protein
MLESIVLGFFVFALSYVGLLRRMARKADVLYGAFVLSPTDAPERGVVAFAARLCRDALSLVRR